jgi:hypothetical protein
MADTPEDPKTGAPEADQSANEGQARPHQKDKGTVVKTAFGERMSGGVADIADGDD